MRASESCLLIKWVVAGIALSSLWTWGSTTGILAGPYAYEEFPVKSTAAQTISKVDDSSHPDAKTFRTRLHEAIGKKTDFAGYYRVVTWGCGTMCQTTALIDSRDGKVYFAPFTSLLGVEYRIHSRLMVENPPDEVKSFVRTSGEQRPDWLETIYWQWDENRKSFQRLSKKV